MDDPKDRSREAMKSLGEHARLYWIGGFGPDEWDFQPEPKMDALRHYDRVLEKLHRYEEML